MIRRFPNELTLPGDAWKSDRKLTRRTETSKYPEEKKTKVIPLVVAIERGEAQTGVVLAASGLKDRYNYD